MTTFPAQAEHVAPPKASRPLCVRRRARHLPKRAWSGPWEWTLADTGVTGRGPARGGSGLPARGPAAAREPPLRSRPAGFPAVRRPRGPAMAGVGVSERAPAPGQLRAPARSSRSSRSSRRAPLTVLSPVLPGRQQPPQQEVAQLVQVGRQRVDRLLVVPHLGEGAASGHGPTRAPGHVRAQLPSRKPRRLISHLSRACDSPLKID